MLVLRSEEPIEQENIDKISLLLTLTQKLFSNLMMSQLFMRLF